MSAPTPAAVRFVLKTIGDGTLEEETAYLADERGSEEMLADHIRAIAEEMRAEAQTAEAKSNTMPLIAAEVAQKYADTLCVFADKLEGKES